MTKLSIQKSRPGGRGAAAKRLVQTLLALTALSASAGGIAASAANMSGSGAADAPGSASAAVRPAARSRWDFDVLLDDSPIGRHLFTITRNGDQTRVESIAAFDVKLLGLTVFRYRYEDHEQWSGACLVGMQSKTDDDGTPERVDARPAPGGGLLVKAERKSKLTTTTLPGCVMSFAYWDPAMLRQTALLNGQTGKLTDVTIKPLPDAKVRVGSKTVEARRYSLTGGDYPLVLSYSPQGEWLALESTVSGGKRLRYQLRD